MDPYGYGGGGYNYGALPNRRNVGSDTSSKDPVMIRSRIFIGGLNTFTVSREDVIDLFSNYGTILGVTLFKGFAFVQYSSPSEADLAVSALNLYNWNGSVLDVKVQTPHLVEKSAAKKAAVASIADQSMTVGSGNGAASQKPFQIGPALDAKRAKLEPHDPISSGMKEMSDLFICGNCHFATHGLEAFTKHRKTPCDKMTTGKREDEPVKFSCNTCGQQFVASWDLLDHTSKTHGLTVFKEVAAVTQ